MTRLAALFLTILFNLSLCFAQNDPLPDTSFTLLSGELTETITNTGKPYLVVGDISIPPGVTVSIEAGVVLLFKDFTGLQVRGTLLAKGTKEDPIIFSSKNDGVYVSNAPMPAAPYDWNGLMVYESALGTTLKWCKVYYSLYGINSLLKSIALANCSFSRNGKSDFLVEGNAVPITKQPFTYNYIESSQSVPGMANSGSRISGSKRMLRVASSTACIAGLALGTWEYVQFTKKNTTLKDLTTFSKYASKRGITNLWEQTRKERDDIIVYTAAGYGLALIGAVGLTVTFLW